MLGRTAYLGDVTGMSWHLRLVATPMFTSSFTEQNAIVLDVCYDLIDFEWKEFNASIRNLFNMSHVISKSCSYYGIHD